MQTSGSHRIDLQTDAMGLAAGIYLLNLQAGDRSSTQHIVVR